MARGERDEEEKKGMKGERSKEEMDGMKEGRERKEVRRELAVC